MSNQTFNPSNHSPANRRAPSARHLRRSTTGTAVPQTLLEPLEERRLMSAAPFHGAPAAHRGGAALSVDVRHATKPHTAATTDAAVEARARDLFKKQFGALARNPARFGALMREVYGPG